MTELSDAEKTLAYNQSVVDRMKPPFVPARIRLKVAVRGSGPFSSLRAEPGEYDSQCNQWGAVDIKTSDGKSLGVMPSEFDVLTWQKNKFSKTIETAYQLIMKSGVAMMNDCEYGLFEHPDQATTVGQLLLDADRTGNSPEWVSFEVFSKKG